MANGTAEDGKTFLNDLEWDSSGDPEHSVTATPTTGAPPVAESSGRRTNWRGHSPTCLTLPASAWFVSFAFQQQ